MISALCEADWYCMAYPSKLQIIDTHSCGSAGLRDKSVSPAGNIDCPAEEALTPNTEQTSSQIGGREGKSDSEETSIAISSWQRLRRQVVIG